MVIDLESVRSCGQTSLPRESEPGLQKAFRKLSEYEDQTYASLIDSGEIVIWGAAAKGVVFAAKAPPAIKNKIAYAIDINPSKQGHFMPISGIEVVDPDAGISRLDSSSLIVIMNPNYEQEIRGSLPQNQPCMVLH